LLLPLSNGGSKALGNVEHSDRAILVEFHHIVGSVGGDGSQRSCGGPYGGRRANGHLDQSVDGNSGHVS
jgi:hypothetical protein